jgi:hypothetical protein
MDVSSAWSDYQRRRRQAWIAFLGYIPGVFVLGVPLGLLFRSGWPFQAVAIGWLALSAVTSYRMGSFPCPRCHKPFFRTWWYHNSFARRCVHCGLPKWSSEDATAVEHMA